MGGFQCSQCGLCCKVVGSIPGFPEPVKEDGSCAHLNEDNTCSIYEKRPLICRIDDGYDLLFSKRMSREEWHALNYKGCRTLQLAAMKEE